MARLPYASISPAGHEAFRDLNNYLASSGIAPLLQLIYLRVSQINGCSYAVDEHWMDAAKSGADLRKLNALVVWRETPFFNERERAALKWAESVTNLSDRLTQDQNFVELRQYFSDKEIVDLTYAVSFMNAINRLAVAFHVTPLNSDADTNMTTKSKICSLSRLAPALVSVDRHRQNS